MVTYSGLLFYYMHAYLSSVYLPSLLCQYIYSQVLGS